MHTNFVPDAEPEGEETARGVVGGTMLFNRFTLQKVLGRGGMGIVWLARDERLDRLVALKLVPESICFDPSAQEDLKRETRRSLTLTHPNIVRIFDFIEDDNSAAISMEYVDGLTVSSMRVKRPSKCFEIEDVAPWVASWCDALSYAHESVKLVHRDIKPSNLMVNSKGEVKITDFGIACTLRDSMSHISVRTSSGTLNYMSPQQLLGEDPAPSDDIYAVGATLYEMLSSKPPFFGGDVASQVREVIPPTITQRRAKFGINGAPIPKHWEETIARCLAKTPEQRPRTAFEIASRLRLGGPTRLPLPVEKGPGAWPVIAKSMAKVDKRLVAAAGIIVAVIGIGQLTKRAAMDQPVAPIAQRHPKKPATFGYAMEKPHVPTPTPATVEEKAEPTPEPEQIVAMISSSPPPISSALPDKSSERTAPVIDPPSQLSWKSAALQVTTTPPGASYSIYAGVVANKTEPTVEPLRRGTTPDSLQDLPVGRYTLYFREEGWPEDRAEVSLNAGETVPLDYTFPHGMANICSNPDGAEIFLGKRSLGKCPLTVALPLGKPKLTASLGDFPERTQTITVAASEMPAEVKFDMKAPRRSRVRPTPTPTAMDKLGTSLKHFFGSKEPTPRPRKRRSD